jgi:peptidase M28-like protein
VDTIPALLAQIAEERLHRSVSYLAKDPLPYRKLNFTVPDHTRNTLYEADAWIETQLREWGYPVEREACDVRAFGYDAAKPPRHRYAPPSPDAPLLTAYNLYAKKVGRRVPGEIIMVLAHKDSQSWVDSPGAYDNGAGTAAVLEIARVLAPYPPERSIWFLFCNEEHTPWTSVKAAENCRRRGDDLIAVINVDSVGGKSDEEIAAGRKTNATLYTTPEGRPLAELMTEVNERYGIGLRQSCHQRDRPGDDDGSFVKAGYGRAIANIGSWPYADAGYHLASDTAERVDIVNVRMAAQATLAAICTLDAAP